MARARMICTAALLAVCTIVHAAPPRAGAPLYVQIGRIAGPPLSGWDYASVDAQARRLYLAADPIVVLDLDRGKVVATWPVGAKVHSVVASGRHTMAVTDASTNAVLFADAATGHAIARTPTGAAPTADGWHNPDFMLLEPKTGLLVAANGDSGALLLINPATHTIAGRIDIGGKLESAAADGRGRLFVNLPDTHAVAVIDIAKRAVLHRVTMAGCEDPSGIAYDAASDTIISVCGNGVAKLIAAQTLTEIASLPVAHGTDAVMLDPARHMAFIAGAEDGKLTVVYLAGRLSLVTQTLDTEPGIRLGALDPVTGRLYLPTIKVDLKAPPLILPGLPPLPRPIPHTFGFLVVAPAS